MKIFDAMSDRTVQIFGLAFCLALERDVFACNLIEEDIMTAPEIYQCHNDWKKLSARDMRRWLNEIASSIEEYDKRNANIDTLNKILARMEFVGHIAEGKHD